LLLCLRHCDPRALPCCLSAADDAVRTSDLWVIPSTAVLLEADHGVHRVWELA